MNKQRRKEIDAIILKIHDVAATVQALKEEIEEVIAQEQDALDALPDSFRDGERGQSMEEGIGTLEDAVSDLDGFDFDDVAGKLEEAKGGAS